MPRTMEPEELDTPRFGRLTVAPEHIWTFPGGLIGLPECRRFIRLAFAEVGMPFEWLQSVDDPSLAFLIAQPTRFFPEYVVTLRFEELGDIELETEAEGELRTIVTVTDQLADMTTNLLGPLVLNVRRKLAKQLVLADARYSTKHRLFPEGTAHVGAAPSAG